MLHGFFLSSHYRNSSAKIDRYFSCIFHKELHYLRAEVTEYGTENFKIKVMETLYHYGNQPEPSLIDFTSFRANVFFFGFFLYSLLMHSQNGFFVVSLFHNYMFVK